MQSFSSLCEFCPLESAGWLLPLGLEHPEAVGSQCLIKTPGFCCVSAQLQLKHFSLQVLDAGALEDGIEKALYLPASPFTELSPLPAHGVYPPKSCSG